MCSIDEEWMNFISSQQSTYGSNISMSVHQNSFLNSQPNEYTQKLNLKISDKNIKKTNTTLKNKKGNNLSLNILSYDNIQGMCDDSYTEDVINQVVDEECECENEEDDNGILNKSLNIKSSFVPTYIMNKSTCSILDGILPEKEIGIVEEMPLCDDLYISTKTKVVFLNKEIDIHNVFWNIPIIEYWCPSEGVIKKQMKVVSKTVDEFKDYQDRVKNISYYTENIIKQIDTRGKFKDERKITVGISKKDIMNYRGKVKNAFYNCFAMIIRFKYENIFREIHIKVFNTGKMEIPGIFNTDLLEIVKTMVLQVIQPYVKEPLYFVENDVDENVLINSNFNCGFYVNREKLHVILKKKYGIETSYDPCSYPGVKCKFYFNNEKGFHIEEQSGKIMNEDCSMKMSELGENKKYTEVSFMVFRTGSCLIVGNCSERILVFIFEFVKKILQDEYTNICVSNEKVVAKVKKTKLRKKTVMVTHNYLQTIKA